jgi:adenine-specific DNA-methyltransferase
MATGVPKKRRRGESRWQSRGITAEHAAPMRLEYAGKAADGEILAQSPSEVARLWPRGEQCGENRLYFGDNLGILAALLRDKDVLGKVRLVYVDPPFATQTMFHSRKLDHAYEDTLSGAEFVESLRKRLVILRELMARDGSIYLHLDEKMIFHMKIVLDEIFGPENYRNCITRKKCNPKNYTRNTYGNVSDFILFYTKSEKYVWNRPVEAWTEGRAKEYQYVEPQTGRRFMKVPVHAPGVRNGATGTPWRGVPPPPGKHWQFPPKTLDEMDARGEIFWSANGNPRRKVYLDESPGVGVQDIWLDFRDAHNQNIRITGYPTEKNPELLDRIIAASSNAGDLVLDCYCGSGTTLAVASQLGRPWIGVDNSLEAIRTTLRRFAVGTEPMGDFVSQRKEPRHPPKASRVKQRSLFHAAVDDSASLPAGKGHHPILDFSLLAEISVADTLTEAVRDWEGQPEAVAGLRSE